MPSDDPCLEHPPLPDDALFTLQARDHAARDRLVQLARAIEADVIPRLVQVHRSGPAVPVLERASSPGQTARQVAAFVRLLVDADDARLRSAVQSKLRAGLTVEALYLDLFAPAAGRLGDLWLADRCDFSTVTVALGRLQRLLRELSPAFGSEVQFPANGRRILLAQPADEQHSFGLAMVAEFFRRDGWDVVAAVGGSSDDAGVRLSNEWADVVGFSIGSELRLEWLRRRIQEVKAASRNPHLVVMVGGPIFRLHPDWVSEVGADATSSDAREAPRLAAQLILATPLRL